MKVWLLEDFAGLRALRRADATEPKPATGEVLLEVTYAALNPADRFLAEGHYPAKPSLPHILGRDGMGIVLETGPGVAGITPGESMLVLRSDVGVLRWGTFAERVVVPAESLAIAPPNWSEQQAGCAGLVYLTAYQALTQWDPQPISVVLVTGASGGVGVATIQLARAMGYTVVALSRSPAKRARLEELGAAITADPQDPNWRANVVAKLADRRVDLVVDNVSGPLLPEAIHTLGAYGRVSVVGSLAGPVPQFNSSSLLFRRIRIGGVAVGTYTPAESRIAWQAITALLQKHDARPLIDSIFPFDDLPAAFDKLVRGPMGKVVLAVKG